ncbi:quinone-dependent dihydroorotate dehydrogenase [Crossiella sp. SN42]|uniref:quinone-dependent dihydroorotate dehydrogenase n=1 Tax=Crossiella sp. SN42 TaxID=2944808 RepID=UPI00207CF2DC|nr:quinone-dependent dihydroorotate dehydrogenase [Crossiella sp. SN42]MCO1581011.1 quinone-dependent dihydroorotate dehydrogenase [Crossiella sp. SN42]
MLYRLILSLVLRRFDAERVHHLSFGALKLLAAIPGVLPLVRRLLAPRDPALRTRVLGLDLPGPLGLAAGFDKDATGPDALAALGFGFVEIGTLTAHAQPGNPKPRLFRLFADRAIVNRMGFNNGGAAAAAQRLRARRARGQSGVVGVNIGKTKATPEAEAVGDYVTSAKLLAGVADYFVVNVSSPNTPGLRNLQAVDQLRPLLTGVRAALDEAGRRVPLLVKIAPDLSDEDVDAVADLALELGLDGIIATNTTIGRDGLASPAAEVARAGAGGLSGAPLKQRSLAVLRRLRARTGDRLVLVSVGGIESAEDVWQRLRAGASLVQGYTGLIYGGPLWPWRIHRDLSRRLRASGYRSLDEVVARD